MAASQSQAWVRLVCIMGMIVSGYAVYAEHMFAYHEAHPELGPFRALCDIGSWASCSKVFHSEQGRVFSHLGLIPKGSIIDQPNALYGTFFYIIILLLTEVNILGGSLQRLFLFLMTTFGIVLSGYLGYVLFFILKDFCVVCVSSYIFNTILFLISTSRFFSGDGKAKAKAT